MTVRNPLVRDPTTGKIVELAAGDTIGGAPTGSPGTPGINWLGAWSSSTTYQVDDAVSSGGSSYICILSNTNQTPPNATYWNVLSSAGTNGSAATISVGTTTTGAAGTSASVTNSGSSSAAVFNFTIPKGDTGATGPAGSSGDFVKLTEVVTSSSQASVTFSSITNTYRDLQVRVRGRNTNASTGVTLWIQFNGDTGANYDAEEFHFVSSSSGGLQTVAGTQWAASDANGFNAANAPTSSAAFVIIDIADYRGTTFFKACQARQNSQIGTGATTQIAGMSSCTYRSTSAISSIKVFFSAGNFVDNSVVSLYGIN